MTSPVPTSPSLFVSDDESDRSFKRGYHDFLYDGPADLDSTKNTSSTGPVTPRKRLRKSNQPESTSLLNSKECAPNETVNLSPITPSSPVFPTITTPVEDTRLATGLAEARLAKFTEIGRTYMIAGARKFACEATERQQDIADSEFRERETLEDIFKAQENLLESAQTYHDLPKSFELVDNFSYAMTHHGGPHLDNVLAVHQEAMATVTIVQESVDALLQTLRNASQAVKQIMVDHAEAWDQQRAEAAREVEKHRVNLQVLEQWL